MLKIISSNLYIQQDEQFVKQFLEIKKNLFLLMWLDEQFVISVSKLK